VRGQFLVEIAPVDGAGTAVGSIDELNTLFTAWVETEYHRRVHDETGQTPLDRWHTHFADSPAVLPDPALLREAFLWSEYRTVSKTATVSLFGNSYCVDPAVVGRKVELLFDPFDLERIEVRWSGTPMGVAVPHRIGRHSHPAVSEPSAQPVAETGIDYLRLLQTIRDDQRAREVVNFDALTAPANGQHHNHPTTGATPAADEPGGDQPEPENMT
jgi:putative transposase